MQDFVAQRDISLKKAKLHSYIWNMKEELMKVVQLNSCHGE